MSPADGGNACEYCRGSGCKELSTFQVRSNSTSYPCFVELLELLRNLEAMHLCHSMENE